MVIKGVVFDIDDTLYLERDYVLGGFRQIADLVGRSEGEREVVARWLEDAFESGVRGTTFDRLLESFPPVADRLSVDKLVEAYRGHTPVIDLAPDVVSTLDALRAGGQHLAILSDGPLASQTAKATALGLSRWFDPIVFTAALGPGAGKPATAGFASIARAWDLAPEALAYVADNPEKDFAGPRALGWLTVRLRQPGQLRYELEPQGEALRPDVEIRAIAGLLPGLRTAEVD
jgi:putative hydrolase of the HAD superfamily